MYSSDNGAGIDPKLSRTISTTHYSHDT